MGKETGPALNRPCFEKDSFIRCSFQRPEVGVLWRPTQSDVVNVIGVSGRVGPIPYMGEAVIVKHKFHDIVCIRDFKKDDEKLILPG